MPPPPPPKSVIVTGGASGIGLAVVRHLASQSHDSDRPIAIAILDVDAEAGAAAAESVAAEFPRARVSSYACDVASWDAQAEAFEHVFRAHGGRLDVVVANAGVSEGGVSSLARIAGVGIKEGGEGGKGEGEEAPARPSVKAVEVNLLGVVYSVSLAVHYMNKKGKANGGEASRGSIICTASNAGLYPLPVAPLYAASKFGVVGLVRSMARVLEKAGIQINALAPAVLDTNISSDKDLLNHMVVTPMATLLRAVDQFLADPSVSGEVAEIHGHKVTIRPPHEYVDEESRQNIETFWTLGYA